MNIASLSLINFKNHREATLEFDPGVNVFSGHNGQGKTNLLDAIHYLSFCKSYFNPFDAQNILHGEEFFLIEGEFVADGDTAKLQCSVQRGKKKIFRKNKEEYERLAEHIGKYPSVVISPYDKDLISEGSEIRRRFVDSIISQYDRVYLDHLISYNKILRQRNALLKEFWDRRHFDPEALEIWDVQLVDHAEVIHRKRKEFVTKFTPIFESHYRDISGGAEEIGLTYRSQLAEGDFAEVLLAHRAKDQRSQFTNAGVHKDDLRFSIGGHPLKRYGSQGQQKTYLIALKLAQFDLVAEAVGKTPILLLDDIFDKIDDRRVRHLMTLVGDGRFGQIFITDTNADRVQAIFSEISKPVRMFHIHQGQVHEAQRQ